MSKEKVYEPEVVQDNPFPGGEVVPVGSSTTTSGGNYEPTTVKSKPIPAKRIAVELLSTALNTRSKKILQEFEFAPSGAIQVGDFKTGQTGDLRISPNGIVARDTAGLTTFAIDGTTGSAVFKGEVRSGTLVTGEVIVGENSVIIDGLNRRIIVNDGTNDRIIIGYDESGF